MVKRVGHIDIPGDVDIWPHELETAKALARAGHNIKFVKKSNDQYKKTADCYIDGELWESKAPKASNARGVERNLQRALHQASRVVFDGRRMKNFPDDKILHELLKWIPKVKSCRGLKFIKRSGEIVDIK